MKHLWVSLAARSSLLAACLAPAWAAEPVAAQPFEAALAQADERFIAGDLEGALRLLEPACAGGERPECAFSLGAVHHGLGHCRQARAFYLRYLELTPNGERVSEARGALEEVEARCGGSVEVASSAVAPDLPRAMSPGAVGLAPTPSAPAMPGLAEPWVAPSGNTPPAPVSREAPQGSLSADLAVGSLALAGAAALSSIAFGLLAAHDANRCAQARSYDREYIERCESSGPRYQGLWQGFAVASGSFLGIGLALWAFDPGPSSAAAASGPSPQLGYRGRF